MIVSRLRRADVAAERLADGTAVDGAVTSGMAAGLGHVYVGHVVFLHSDRAPRAIPARPEVHTDVGAGVRQAESVWEKRRRSWARAGECQSRRLGRECGAPWQGALGAWPW